MEILLPIVVGFFGFVLTGIAGWMAREVYKSRMLLVSVDTRLQHIESEVGEHGDRIRENATRCHVNEGKIHELERAVM